MLGEFIKLARREQRQARLQAVLDIGSPLVDVALGQDLRFRRLCGCRVALPGGVDANRKIPIAMTYPGAPQIQPGENVFLFLTASTDVVPGSYTVAGFSQGKFSIVTDEDGVQVVSRDLTKTALKDNNGVRRGSNNTIPLENLKNEVRGYLKNQ